jgi:Polysaccharide lyase
VSRRSKLLVAALLMLGVASLLGSLGASASGQPSLLASDTAASRDANSFWGEVECAKASRYSFVGEGGDGHSTATGAPQGNTSYRKLTVIDGDDYYGERCELGENDTEGPTAFYREGDHRVTYLSERLPANFPIATHHWQTVMQMKQAQPSHDAGLGPAIELQVREGKWFVVNHWKTVWTFPARRGAWTRFAWDVSYSKNAGRGRIQVSADLNADGDFNDPGERSPAIHGATLATEVPGYSGDPTAPGSGIPSHLRIGIYHDTSIPCPPPSGCSIDIDDVQVLEAP